MTPSTSTRSRSVTRPPSCWRSITIPSCPPVTNSMLNQVTSSPWARTVASYQLRVWRGSLWASRHEPQSATMNAYSPSHATTRSWCWIWLERVTICSSNPSRYSSTTSTTSDDVSSRVSSVRWISSTWRTPTSWRWTRWLVPRNLMWKVDSWGTVMYISATCKGNGLSPRIRLCCIRSWCWIHAARIGWSSSRKIV